MGIIGTIRKHSWVAVAIVGIAIVAFIIGDLTKNNRGIGDMGEINGTTVTYQHFNYRLNEMEDMLRRQQGMDQIPADMEYQLREQVWQMIVDETILGAEYEALGLMVSEAEMNDMFAGTFIHPYVRQSFTDPTTGQFNLDNIRSIINNFDNLDSNFRMQWADLQNTVREDRMLQKYRALISQGFYMPVAMAEQIAAMDKTGRDVLVAALPYSGLSDAEAPVDEKDYEKYYKKHKAEFRVSEEIRDIDMVVFAATPSDEDLQQIEKEVMEVWDSLQAADNSEVPYLVNSESDHSYDSTYVRTSALEPALDSLVSPLAVGQYVSPRIIGNEWVMAKVLNIANRPDSIRASVISIYNNNIQGITRTADEAQALADSIAAQLRAGHMEFDAAAGEYSDTPQQSDFGWALDGSGAYGFMNETVVNTPVDGIFVMEMPREMGYVVGKVTGKTTPAKKYRLALITREIQPSDETMRLVEEQARSFASNNRTYDEMRATASAAGMQMRTVQLTAMMQNVGNYTGSRDIVQWAFNDKTAVGSVADQVFDSENNFIVVALKDVLKKGYATLDQVRTMIDQQVRIDKKAEVLMAKASDAMQGATNIDAVAGKLSVAVDTVENSTFSGYFFGKFGMEPKMQGAAAAAQKGAMFGPVKGASGVYVATVFNEQENGTASSDVVRNRFSQQYTQKARMASMVLRQNADINDYRNRFF